jgi:hypothetical protein
MLYTIQLMTFDKVNTRIDQPMEHDIHLGIRGEYLLLLHSINASLFPEYCRIENYIHVVRSAIKEDIHLGCPGEYHVPWVDQSLYSPYRKSSIV